MSVKEFYIVNQSHAITCKTFELVGVKVKHLDICEKFFYTDNTLKLNSYSIFIILDIKTNLFSKLKILGQP